MLGTSPCPPTCCASQHYPATASEKLAQPAAEPNATALGEHERHSPTFAHRKSHAAVRHRQLANRPPPVCAVRAVLPIASGPVWATPHSVTPSQCRAAANSASVSTFTSIGPNQIARIASSARATNPRSALNANRTPASRAPKIDDTYSIPFSIHVHRLFGGSDQPGPAHTSAGPHELRLT